jgi:hypothetical protein
MRRVVQLVLALLPSLALAGLPRDAEREDSNEWAKGIDKNVIKEAARDHEADPLSRESRTRLAPMLLAHFEDVPYVVCLDQVPGLEEEGQLGKALLWQMVFGTGVFIEQNPRRATDREAYMLAGLQSAVRAYRNVRTKSPKKAIAVFDELDELERQGKLRDHVRAHSCVKKP